MRVYAIKDIETGKYYNTHWGSQKSPWRKDSRRYYEIEDLNKEIKDAIRSGYNRLAMNLDACELEAFEQEQVTAKFEIKGIESEEHRRQLLKMVGTFVKSKRLSRNRGFSLERHLYTKVASSLKLKHVRLRLEREVVMEKLRGR